MNAPSTAATLPLTPAEIVEAMVADARDWLQPLLDDGGSTGDLETDGDMIKELAWKFEQYASGVAIPELVALRAKAAISVCVWCGHETTKDPEAMLAHAKGCRERPERLLLTNNGKLIDLVQSLLLRDSAVEMLLRELRPIVEASPEGEARTCALATIELALGSASESVPTESQTTGGGDSQEVCTGCHNAVVSPHPWRECVATMGSHLLSVTDHAVDLQMKLDATLAQRDAACALLREAGRLVVSYGIQDNQDVYDWALRVVAAMKAAEGRP